MGLAVPDDIDSEARHRAGLSDSIRHLAPTLEHRASRAFSRALSARIISPAMRRFRCSTACARCWRNSMRADSCLASPPARSRRGLTRALAQHGIAHRFDVSRCADEGFPKPHPDMLLALMDQAGVAPDGHADDRRHHARPATRAKRGRGIAGRGLWRAPAGGIGGNAAAGDGSFDRGVARMAGDERLGCAVCASASLEEAARAFVSPRIATVERQPAFAIRFRGQVRAYVNECRHQRSELDWRPGEFFDDAKLYLVCATHGALYAPDTGMCVAGPCKARGFWRSRCRSATAGLLCRGTARWRMKIGNAQ